MSDKVFSRSAHDQHITLSGALVLTFANSLSHPNFQVFPGVALLDTFYRNYGNHICKHGDVWRFGIAYQLQHTFGVLTETFNNI